MPLDVTVDSLIGKQFGQVAFGHHQVEQIRAVGLLGVFVLGLELAHFLSELDDLLDGRHLVSLGGHDLAVGIAPSGVRLYWVHIKNWLSQMVYQFF